MRVVVPSHSVEAASFGATSREKFENSYIPEPMSGCWLWLGPINAGGYGQFFSERSRHGIRAHRVSFALYRESVPANAYVLHRCDNRLCVNPDHLWIGDYFDNMADRERKGRAARGDASGVRRKPGAWDYSKIAGQNHYSAKLTWEIVDQIRATQGTISNREWARRVGVNHGHISAIRTGKTWVRRHAT